MATAGKAMTTATVQVGGEYVALNGITVRVEAANKAGRRTTFTVAGKHEDGSEYVGELPASSLFAVVR